MYKKGVAMNIKIERRKEQTSFVDLDVGDYFVYEITDDLDGRLHRKVAPESDRLEYNTLDVETGKLYKSRNDELMIKLEIQECLIRLKEV
jgi:hypothetical protein